MACCTRRDFELSRGAQTEKRSDGDLVHLEQRIYQMDTNCQLVPMASWNCWLWQNCSDYNCNRECYRNGQGRLQQRGNGRGCKGSSSVGTGDGPESRLTIYGGRKEGKLSTKPGVRNTAFIAGQWPASLNRA